MLRFLRRGATLSVLVASILVVACVKPEKKPTQSYTEVKDGGVAVVATIDGAEIKDKDIRSNPQVKMNLYKAMVKVFDAEKQEHDTYLGAVNAHIEEKLLDREAKERGVAVDKLLDEEIDKKATAPTEAEVKAFYDERGINRPYEAIKDRIAEHLGRQKQIDRRQVYVDTLKKKYNVAVSIGDFAKAKPLPPKVEVSVTDSHASMGPKNAKVTIVEFSDYQCPYCARTEETVKAVMKKYKDKIRLVYRHYPLPFHQEAKPAAIAAECAKDQGKFWEYHDLLFENQRALKDADLNKYAEQLKLDKPKFDACIKDGGKGAIVDQDMTEARSLGVTGTPAFFINGRMISGAKPIEEFEEIIDRELKGS